ncbi:tRNA (N6-threonylcarbamoyladenosine(37)-N6)-methyltransferase TrmO [Coralliovum pocilloporae]|uniref:tRNA (N6-threonylcarbamoyladenosine(37)-N6)-methyltransferase TrmO n=1 Tax=Coralliovum pocilloporae TaxID=3066369 RepID=UPI003306DD4C
MSEIKTHWPPEGEADASLYYIGRIRTPWTTKRQCPRNAQESEVICQIELLPQFQLALRSLDTATHIIVLYWLNQADRDLVVQHPSFDNQAHGTFALRSPNRPNPIGLSVARLISINESSLSIRHIDCLDGTPLLDIKPYLPNTDAITDAHVGWYEQRAWPDRRRSD